MTDPLPQFHLLLHSAHLIEERLRKRLASLDIQPRQARVLDALGRMGATSQAGLAKEFDLTGASMSTMTARLLKAGLISRHIDPHERRSNVLSLTSEGRALLDTIYREWAAIDREIVAALGAAQAGALRSLTLTLRDALGARTLGGGS